MGTKTKIGFGALGALTAWILLQLVNFEYTIPSPEQFVRSHGYPLESHEVTTEDGYILTLFRIPYGKGQENSNRRPVLLHHGLIGSSYNFIGLGPKSSLGFVLADKGYDVWLANCRGVKYSLKHISYNSSDSEFWNFSWHEIGVYDLPAVIDYILKTTNKGKLSYIGHSLGGTVLATLLTSKPEYNNKLDVFIGLVPAINFEICKSNMLKFLSKHYAPFRLNVFGHGNWLPGNDIMLELFTKSCHPEGLMRFICLSMMNEMGNSSQLKEENLVALARSSFSSFSLKTFVHYGQALNKGKFIHFNYGPEENKRRYGSVEPPEYDLKKITVPTILFYSDCDDVTPSEGVLKSSEVIPNASAYRVPLETFNHVDFLYGKDVVDLLYKKMISVLNKRSLIS